ncbi:cytochrome d ubiquinol oxidase subunit II [Echinicola vietnamensis]|uniref:Cytochrome bd-type quinol oxidase, subunit 2 n=1 Tax=Echinicola vietnamensis (strain DSM 17526 / LMG 23754 / KMM 6221) TaxID=926556 RepID=L0G0R9_ECHVK|nr:cytochrome d ubiquinol oxidase subunit II [Echinicola vietnamensis]AGA78586.1 cytochrome bd-type quinol oxidase, subunit 2 [Echinicola vietnamensis DSM 17526]
MLYVVIAFLYLSLLFYLLFGGADFGAGIIELFSGRSLKERTRLLTYQAIGPIWEANHMWLIITIVILFVGFPEIYTLASVYLHIPLSLLLIGIIARGTAFIFRHYDAVKDHFQKVYNLIFVYSSFMTPFFLGILAGTAISGRINPEATDFVSAYLSPWLGWFPLSVGVFTVVICGFLAAVYLIGEANNNEDRDLFRQKAFRMNILTVITGGLVFLVGEWEGIPLFTELINHPVGLAALVLATLSLPVTWLLLKKKKVYWPRVLVGFQITMILITLMASQHPDFIVLQNSTISLENAAAGESTIFALGMALLIGSLFILPALFYLIYSFQKQPISVKKPLKQ